MLEQVKGYYFNLNEKILREANHIFPEKIDTEIISSDYIQHIIEKKWKYFLNKFSLFFMRWIREQNVQKTCLLAQNPVFTTCPDLLLFF